MYARASPGAREYCRDRLSPSTPREEFAPDTHTGVSRRGMVAQNEKGQIKGPLCHLEADDTRKPCSRTALSPELRGAGRLRSSRGWRRTPRGLRFEHEGDDVPPGSHDHLMFHKKTSNYSGRGLEGYAAYFPDACSGAPTLILSKPHRCTSINARGSRCAFLARPAAEIRAPVSQAVGALLFALPLHARHEGANQSESFHLQRVRRVGAERRSPRSRQAFQRGETPGTCLAYSRYADYVPAWLERFP